MHFLLNCPALNFKVLPDSQVSLSAPSYFTFNNLVISDHTKLNDSTSQFSIPFFFQLHHEFLIYFSQLSSKITEAREHTLCLFLCLAYTDCLAQCLAYTDCQQIVTDHMIKLSFESIPNFICLVYLYLVYLSDKSGLI